MNALQLLQARVRYLRNELRNESPGTRREVVLLASLRRARTALYREMRENPTPAQAAFMF